MADATPHESRRKDPGIVRAAYKPFVNFIWMLVYGAGAIAVLAGLVIIGSMILSGSPSSPGTSSGSSGSSWWEQLDTTTMIILIMVAGATALIWKKEWWGGTAALVAVVLAAILIIPPVVGWSEKSTVSTGGSASSWSWPWSGKAAKTCPGAGESRVIGTEWEAVNPDFRCHIIFEVVGAEMDIGSPDNFISAKPGEKLGNILKKGIRVTSARAKGSTGTLNFILYPHGCKENGWQCS